jgi:uncharacterized membrane protein
MGEKMIESRLPRGIFGKIVKWTFILFNLFMIFALVTGFNAATENINELQSEAEQAGRAIGTGLGVAVILGVWVIGVIIMTPVLFLTRGKKVLEKVVD